jgi:NAD(P)-dependent dehydrogenase (short-subunit alcohol dehydrogenase family)
MRVFFFLIFLPFLNGHGNGICNICKGTSQLLPSTIAIFGGTGKLGNECVYQALQRDHQVVVLGRNQSKLVIPEGSGGQLSGEPIHDSRLKFIPGSVVDPEDVDHVFSQNDVTGVIIGHIFPHSSL